MTGGRINIHATAVVIGEAGLLFVGPSGIGKSMTAFNCLAAARRAGAFGALVADDQVFVSQEDGILTAECPNAIAGMIEIRGSGIARLPHVPAAAIHLAVLLVDQENSDRLPPEQEAFDLPGIGTVPQLRMVQGVSEPLSIIAAFHPHIGIPAPF